MKTIVTRYMPPAGQRGARVKATDGDHSVTVPYTYENDYVDHDRAATALCKKLKWTGAFVSGALPRNAGRVYVFAKDHKLTVESSDPVFQVMESPKSLVLKVEK